MICTFIQDVFSLVLWKYDTKKQFYSIEIANLITKILVKIPVSPMAI